MNRIEQLKQLKKSFTYETIELEIESLMESFWKNYYNDDLYNLNLKDFQNFHTFIMEEVNTLHNEEQSDHNEEQMLKHLSFKEIVPQCEEGQMGHRIYTFTRDRSYYFIGDLHSDDVSLKDTLRRIDFFKRVKEEDFKLIFLGDYVDRGKNHLKILERLMILKILFPKHIYLLRGNHDGGILNEDDTITLPYRIPEKDVNEWYFPMYLKTLEEKNKTVSKELLVNYLNFFDQLAYVAVVENAKEVIFGVHGGLPRPKGEGYYEYLECAGHITDVNHVDHLGKTILQNIMWSDPYRGGELYEDSGRFRYTKEHYSAFKERFSVDLLIRGHEVCKEGFRYHFDDDLITIFSSGGKLSWGVNDESAYEDVEPKVLLIDSMGNRVFI